MHAVCSEMCCVRGFCLEFALTAAAAQHLLAWQL
jgi:hypothetical protein